MTEQSFSYLVDDPSSYKHWIAGKLARSGGSTLLGIRTKISHCIVFVGKKMKFRIIHCLLEFLYCEIGGMFSLSCMK